MVASENGMARAKKVSEDYHQRVKDCENDSFMRLRCAEWLLDSTQRIVKEVRDQNQ